MDTARRWRTTGRFVRCLLGLVLGAGAGAGCATRRAYREHESLAEALAPRTVAAPSAAWSTSASAAEKSDPALAAAAAVATIAPGRITAAMAPAVPPPASTYPIDLPTALRLAEAVNPIIGAARARIGAALGHQQAARALLLPTLNGGVTYDGHAGVLQRSSGQILDVARQALYIGGGAGTNSSNTIAVPAVSIITPLTDALFEPLAAHQQVIASQFDASATANTVLLGVAHDYLELHGAAALWMARRRTEAEAAELARVTTEYARTGECRQADANRGQTEWRLRRAAVRAAEERLAVASARLCRRLQLDPAARIAPTGEPLALFSLVDADADAEQFLQTALRLRPELQARSADIGTAEQRVRQERARPLLPTLWLGTSGGVFGGGSNLVPPLVGDFRGRTDFDVVLYWTWLDFGMGNRALQKQRSRALGMAQANRARVLNEVREEVAAARADVLAWRVEITQALQELATSFEGFQRDFERVQGVAAPPLEALNNLQFLGAARDALVDSVVAYNQAQFRLYVALGAPPPLTGPTEPHPPAGEASLFAGPPRLPRPPAATVPTPRPADLPAAR